MTVIRWPTYRLQARWTPLKNNHRHVLQPITVTHSVTHSALKLSAPKVKYQIHSALRTGSPQVNRKPAELNPTQNPFDPLLNTEQEKAATAEMNQTEGTDSHTPADTTQRRHRQENTEKSKDNIPKLSPKEILGNISIPQRASLLLIRDCDQTY